MKTIDGFQINAYTPEREFLVVESNRLEECLACVRSKKLYGISIQSHMVKNDSFQKAFEMDNLNFLNKCPDIKGILISANIADISAVHILSDLRYLSISDNKNQIDFHAFPKLEEASLDWHPKMHNLNASQQLRILTLGKFNSKEKDFTVLPLMKDLIQLSIVQTTITSLSGIDRFPKLERLGVWYGSKLDNISSINKIASTLQSLNFSTCKKIEDLSVLKSLSNLRFLGLNDCGNIESISFIRDMPNLKIFTFVKTNIKDGNLSPCIGLSYAGFLDKRHYSHKHEELSKTFTGKIVGPFDDWGNPIPQERMEWLRKKR